MTTRGRPPGLPKSGGRTKGTLNKEQRQGITAEIAHDILKVYQAMGGPAFLLEFAKAQPGEFIKQCLSRLMPPVMSRDEPEPVNQSLTINTSGLSELEAAMRVAYALSKAQHMQEQLNAPAPLATRLHEPELPPLDQAPQINPDRAQWASDLQLSDEQRRDQSVVRQTNEGSLETYPGSAAEQGFRRRELL